MIISVAIRIKLGEVGDVTHTLPIPARHHHLIHELAESGVETPIKGEEGFMDDERGFVGRLEAGQIAQRKVSC